MFPLIQKPVYTSQFYWMEYTMLSAIPGEQKQKTPKKLVADAHSITLYGSSTNRGDQSKYEWTGRVRLQVVTRKENANKKMTTKDMFPEFEETRRLVVVELLRSFADYQSESETHKTIVTYHNKNKFGRHYKLNTYLHIYVVHRWKIHWSWQTTTLRVYAIKLARVHLQCCRFSWSVFTDFSFSREWHHWTWRV